MLTKEQQIEAFRKYCQEIKYNLSNKKIIEDALFIFTPTHHKDPIVRMKTVEQGVEWLRAMGENREDEYERTL